MKSFDDAVPNGACHFGWHFRIASSMATSVSCELTVEWRLVVAKVGF
jgi:hypothetical protein